MIVINVVICGFSGEDLKMIGPGDYPIKGVRLQPAVRLQLCRLINAKYRCLWRDQSHLGKM